MKAVEIAFFVLCVQIGMGIVTMSGLFGGIHYENSITNFHIGTNISAASETEQIQGSINVYNTVVNTLTWGWIKEYFQPFYTIDATVKGFVDGIIIFLDAISGLLIGAALIEMVRNQTQVF
jgi:hypothetical protein